MKLYTVATGADGYFNVYLNKCKQEGLKMEILGWEDKWKGFAWKFNIFYENLKKLDPKEIVIFTDAYDVLLLNNPQEVERRFKEYDTSILLSVEEEPSNPIHRYLYKKMFPTFDNNFINSGMYMGYAGDILEMLGIIKDQFGLKDSDDDQKVMALFLNKNKEFVNKKCKFDKDKRIFLNVWDKKLRNIDTCFVHGPGNADLSEYVNKYSLLGDVIKKDGKGNRDFWKYNLKAVKSYTKYFILEIILFILFIILLIYIFKRWKKGKGKSKIKLNF